MPRRSPTRPPLPRGRLGSRLLRGAVAAPVPVALADSAAGADSLQVAASVVLADSATAADSLAVVRGFPWWVATGTVATSADTASLQAVLPTGYATDDLLVLDVFHAGPDTVTQNTDMAALGWALAAHATPSGAFGHIWRYTKLAASASETAPTLTFSAANGVVIAVTAIREPGTLASTLTAVDAASNTTPITAPTLTVSTNSLTLVAYGNRVAAPPMATVTPDPDYTEQVDVPTTNAAGSGGTLEVATRGPLTAGTLSGDTWTPSVAGRDLLVITEIRAAGAATPITLTDTGSAADTIQPVAQVTVTDRGQGNDTPPPADPLARTDLIYGSEIGAWLPDGEPAVTVAPTPARHARIPVIRFALHDTFTDLLDPLGNAGQITRADFRHVISAIVGDFHAIPWLKCLPIANGIIGTKDGSIWCPPWTGTIPAVWLNTYKAMLDEVAKVWRGPIIIESNNEMEYACWEEWRDRDGAGLTGGGNAGVSTRIGEHYAQTMGELRRYARDTLGFSHVVVGGYIGIAGGPQWGATVTADGTKPYSYAFSNLGSTWVNEFNNAVKAAYDAAPAGEKADLVPDFIAIHAYSHGGDFSTSATGYEFTDLTGYDSARPDDIAYSYYRQWLTNARARLVAIWGATIGNQIRLAMSEWNAGLANSTSTWSGWTTSGRPGQFYRGWMTMLAGDGTTTGAGTRWWEASMFLLASESDAGASRYYNTVKQDGSVQTWYYDFRDAAAADPATATGVGPAVAATLPLADQAAAADLLDVPLFKSLIDAGVAVEAMAGVLTVVGTLLTAGSSPAASGTYLTGSVSPAAGTVLLVWVEHGGTATLPTLSGLGATWTRQGSVAYGDGTRVLTAHTAPIGGSPGSGQLTISGGAMTHAVWSVVQLTDADPTTPVVGSPASGTATAASSLTVPLAAAAAAGNRPFAGFAADDSTPTQTTPRAGWSELSETVV